MPWDVVSCGPPCRALQSPWRPHCSSYRFGRSNPSGSLGCPGPEGLVGLLSRIRYACYGYEYRQRPSICFSRRATAHDMSIATSESPSDHSLGPAFVRIWKWEDACKTGVENHVRSALVGTFLLISMQPLLAYAFNCFFRRTIRSLKGLISHSEAPTSLRPAEVMVAISS